MALIVRTNGDIETVAPANGIDFSLDEIKFHILMPSSQDVETFLVRSDNKILVYNENPRQGGNELPNNIVNLKYGDQFNGTLLGDVLICDPDQLK